MNNQSIFKKTALATAMATSVALLAACSSGSDTTASTTDTQVTATGVITGFGSAKLSNGVKYNTDDSAKMIDGQLVELSAMAVGQKCTVVGTIDANGTTGTATSITCTDETEGYLLSNDMLTDSTINVMGQVVKVTMDTVFDSDTYTSINDVPVNDIVEVYGYSDGAGNITATRIETKDADTDIEVKGKVSMLDTDALTFMIGTLVVDYSNPADGVVPDFLADDLYVEVKAISMPDMTDPTKPVLAATKVEIEDDGDMGIDGDSDQELEITGLVSDYVADVGFTFNGGTYVDLVSVDVEDTFVITDGMTLTVEGKIDANGVFIPEEVVEEHESEEESYGSVTEVSLVDGTISILKADGVTPQTFMVNNDTRMIDEYMGDQYFDLSKVVAPNYVKIEYYTIDTVMYATEIELKDAAMPTVAE